ncbi:phage baseplate protein [Burkholderia gladioli]|uniref:phage baseplate protein n=1 Tax=Burkholderia gladioli TaxID=28095 RepID=UPI003D2226EF
MTTISDVLDVTLTGGKSIGGVPISAVVEEIYNDDLVITDHPVEKDTPINDHAYQMPRQVVMKCGWSNADYSALLGAASVSFDPTGANTMATGTYVDAVYSKLLKLQADLQLIDVTTTRRKYKNVLVRGLTLVVDPKTSSSLMVTATLKQVNIVSTKATTLPPRANQANPAATAETIGAGAKLATPATPVPGGSVSPF